MEVKNLKKAAKRIKQAVKNKEKIVIFADSDLDGTTSAVILEETIQNLSGKVDLIYFPDRGEDGYGLSEKALNNFGAIAPGVLLILDCGIGSFEGIKKAGSLGFEVIVVDHHEILGKLPQPALIIDPKQPKDKYPFKKMANVSLTYKLSEEILGKKMTLAIQKSFFELAALGTIADMMPEEDYNKKVIEGGVGCLKETFRPGFIALIDFLKQQNPTQQNPRVIFSNMVSILNITELKDNLTESYILFKEKDIDKAKELTRSLWEESQKRQMRIQEIAQQVVSQENQSKNIIFEGSDLWEQVLTGPIASRVCNKTKKPTFIFRIGKEKCRGSLRMPDKRDGVKALQSCANFLEVYGGHPPAAGFTCDNSQKQGLKNCLEEYFKKI